MPAFPLYLDNASTSFPKPPEVARAVSHYLTDIGASPGRGTYRAGAEAKALVNLCRARINTLIGGISPDHVCFTLNGTDALNQAIKGVIRSHQQRNPGSAVRIVTGPTEHNAVVRSLESLRAAGACVARLPADPATGLILPDAVRSALTPDTTLLVLNSVSNVSGAIQPLEAITSAARAANIPVVVDAAQAVGHIPINAASLGADILCFSGHKGCLGPQGVGAMYIRPGFDVFMATSREGGTGSVSESPVHPATMPEKFEAGTPNAPGIAGLSEGVQFLLSRGMDSVRIHDVQLIDAMLHGLLSAGARTGPAPGAGRSPTGPLASLRLLGPTDPNQRTATFALAHDTLAPAELAAILESDFGVLTRAGLHCAPWAHETLGTMSRGGAVRISFGVFNTLDDVQKALAALTSICAG